MNSLRVPRVSITLVSKKLARKIGALGLNFRPVIEHAGGLPTSSDDSSSVDGLEDDVTGSERDCKEDEGVSADAFGIPDNDNTAL